MGFYVRGPGGLLLPEEAAPATPATGTGRLYVATDGTLHFQNDGGVDTTLGAGGGGGASGAELAATTDYTTTQPSSPVSGVKIFTRHRARRLPAFVGPTGQDATLQPAFFSNKMALWQAINNVATPDVEGVAFTNILAPTAVPNASTNFYTGLVRNRFATTATAGIGTGVRTTNAQWFMSSTANAGGFFFVCRFGLNAITATNRGFIGLSATVAALSPTVNPSTLLNLVGFGWDSTDTTQMYFMSNDATSTATRVALGTNFRPQIAATDFYEFRMFSPNAAGLNVYWSAQRLNDGAFIQGQATTDLPALGTMLAAHVHYSNGTTAAVGSLDLQTLYIESDN